MKKTFIIIIAVFSLLTLSCDDYILTPNTEDKICTDDIPENGFLVFSSKEELKNTIDLLINDEPLGLKTVRSTTNDNYYMINTYQFKSLADRNKEMYFESLSAEERAIIENDPDGLEYCVPDSIIADYFFSRVVNPHRMIQVGDSVYKFIHNGVLVTHKNKVSALGNITMVENPFINPNIGVDENGMYIFKLNEDVNFITPNTNSNNNSNNINNIINVISPEKGNPSGEIKLQNGRTIYDVRTVYFYAENDAGELHEFWYGLWGDYVLAVNPINQNYRMAVGLYNTNYANIYAEIGANVKLQKKVLGMWWNVSADEAFLGWEGVELIFETPNITTIAPPDPFAQASSNATNIPDLIKCRFDFNNNEDYLLELPYSTYKEDELVAHIVRKARSRAISKRNGYLTNIVNAQSNNLGAYTINDNHLYITCKPGEKSKINSYTFTQEFYRDLFVFDFNISFVIGSNGVSITDFSITPAELPELGRSSVYGVVKFNGNWYGARVIKQI